MNRAGYNALELAIKAGHQDVVEVDEPHQKSIFLLVYLQTFQNISFAGAA